MMGSACLSNMVPELILLIGGCVTLFTGLMAGRQGRDLCASFAVVVLALALLATLVGGEPESSASLPGLLLSPLTYYVRLITLGMGILFVLSNWHIPDTREHTEYFALILFSILGVLGTASSNDLLVLFLSIELVSVPTYIMIALSRQNPRASESSVKYFFLGAMSAAILAYGFSFLYGAAGTTEMSATKLASLLNSGEPATYAVIGLILTIAGLLFKLAAFPFHVYAADVYEGAASPVTGMLGFLPKVAGFVALIRIFDWCNWNYPAAIFWILWGVAAITMFTGNMIALRQSNVKRTLAYSSIAHSGYMLIALLVGPVLNSSNPARDGVTALLFYIAIYGVMNLGAFIVLTLLRIDGEEVEEFDDLAGLSSRFPLAAAALAICAFSLMGFPPTAGLLGKVFIFAAALSTENHPHGTALIVLAVLGVINSAIAAGYYLKIAGVCYLQKPRDVEMDLIEYKPVQFALATCAILMFLFFTCPRILSAPADTVSKFEPQPVQRYLITTAKASPDAEF